MVPTFSYRPRRNRDLGPPEKGLASSGSGQLESPDFTSPDLIYAPLLVVVRQLLEHPMELLPYIQLHMGWIIAHDLHLNQTVHSVHRF